MRSRAGSVSRGIAPSIWQRRFTLCPTEGMLAMSPSVYGCAGMHHLAHRADLDDATRIHDRDPVGGLRDDAHVVRDQHDGDVVVAREPPQQRDDLRLHRHVKRRGRLVGDHEPGSAQSASAMTTRWRIPPENSCG